MAAINWGELFEEDLLEELHCLTNLESPSGTGPIPYIELYYKLHRPISHSTRMMPYFGYLETLPISESFIEAFKEWLNFERLSQNHYLLFTESLLDKFIDKWNWSTLSWNKSLPLTESFIAKYSDKWDWKRLSQNESLPLTESFIAKYSDKLDLAYLIKEQKIHITYALIKKYADQWDWIKLQSLYPIQISNIFFIETFSDNCTQLDDYTEEERAFSIAGFLNSWSKMRLTEKDKLFDPYIKTIFCNLENKQLLEILETHFSAPLKIANLI